jgi:hypothetical protein
MAREADHVQDEALLHELMRLAGEVESGIAASQFRFGACEAYHGLVLHRIAELRESRIAGLQTINEFMSRRLAPAVATCGNVAQRLKGLAERIGQASALLATRVGIARERQNQALLASMDRRAKLQLRLQQTVEGLSVAAITYYAAGLVVYLAKAAQRAGARIEPDIVVGVTIPIVVVAMLWSLRRMRRGSSRRDRSSGDVAVPVCRHRGARRIETRAHRVRGRSRHRRRTRLRRSRHRQVHRGARARGALAADERGRGLRLRLRPRTAARLVQRLPRATGCFAQAEVETRAGAGG